MLRTIMILTQAWLIQGSFASTAPSFQSTQSPEDQLSCAHLQTRYQIPDATLKLFDYFKKTLIHSNESFSGIDLYSYFNKKTGYSLGTILSEPVFHATVETQNLKTSELPDFDQVDAYAFVGVNHVELWQKKPSPTLSFDISAADVCFNKYAHISMYLDCPNDTATFDICDYNHHLCNEPVYWHSEPVVVEWWKCKREVQIPLDFTNAQAQLGKRTVKIGGGQ